jgi:hypothetical protein
MNERSIPAAPGTYLIHVNNTESKLPVVGFSFEERHRLAHPILLTAGTSMLAGTAYLLPDGGVFDPVWCRWFEYEEDWREAFEGEAPYVPGKTPAVAGHDGKTPPSLRRNADTFVPPKPPSPTPQGGRPPKSLPIIRPGLIGFGKKTYKGKSWWHFVDSDHDFVFVVEAEQPTPKDPACTKVTREEFYSLRKIVPEMEVPPPGSVVTDDQPPLPLGEPDGDDDDDGTDLV